VVKTEDGSEHTFHCVASTTVHGEKDAGNATGETFHGLKEGSKVAVHYSVKGFDETAREVDNLGDDGLKATDGTIHDIDKARKQSSSRLQMEPHRASGSRRACSLL
jgi:hypothetical protein